MTAGWHSLFRNPIAHGDEVVTIDTSVLDNDTGFSVADDGPGLPSGMESAILRQGYSTKPDGTGLDCRSSGRSLTSTDGRSASERRKAAAPASK